MIRFEHSYDGTVFQTNWPRIIIPFPFSAARIIWCAPCYITCSLFSNVYSYVKCIFPQIKSHLHLCPLQTDYKLPSHNILFLLQQFPPILTWNVCRITQIYTMVYRFFESPTGTEMGSKSGGSQNRREIYPNIFSKGSNTVIASNNNQVWQSKGSKNRGSIVPCRCSISILNMSWAWNNQNSSLPVSLKNISNSAIEFATFRKMSHSKTKHNVNWDMSILVEVHLTSAIPEVPIFQQQI